MRIPEDRRSWLKARVMERIHGCPANPVRKYLLAECVEAFLPLEAPHLEEYHRLLLTPSFQGAKQMAESLLEKVEARGEERGRTQGWREVLLWQLENKFGPLSAGARNRMTSWPQERLAELAKAVLTAQSLRDLGLDD